MGDLKPSQFLARARARISKDDISDSVLIEILVAKLPYEAQIALATAVGMPPKDFAAAADAAVRRLPSTSFISSVSQPSSSNAESCSFRNPTTIIGNCPTKTANESKMMIAMNQLVSSRGSLLLVHHINNKHQLVLILMAISHSWIHFHGVLLTDLLGLLVATILHHTDEHEMIQVAHMIIDQD